MELLILTPQISISNLAQGKLPYALSVSTYDNFLRNYIAEKRWVKEQILDLTYGEKITLFDVFTKQRST